MTGPAITLMLVAIVIIWGGLAVSVTALVVRGRREDAHRPPRGRGTTRQKNPHHLRNRIEWGGL